MLANNALTTLEKAKSHLGLSQEDKTPDATVTDFINSASSLIEKYCQRAFGLQTFFELKPGRGSTKLILDNYPIVSLQDVTIDEESINVENIKILAEQGMLYRPKGGFPSYTLGGRLLHPKPDDSQYNVFVEYSAGYVLPKDQSETNPRTLPYDLEHACLRMIGIMYKDKEVASGQNLILKRETMGDWTGEYEPEFKGANNKLDVMDADILAILNLYKRTEFVV